VEFEVFQSILRVNVLKLGRGALEFGALAETLVVV